MKKCSKCKIEKNPEEFNLKSKLTGKRQVQCKECTRLLIKNHYNKNRDYYLEKAKKRNLKSRQEINLYLFDYFSKNPCIDCGESDPIVLEFDHTGKVPKFKAVSHLARNYASLLIIVEEIKKCEVRCANCHRRKTAVDFNWFKNKMHP
ncbi:MAG: hypothetical protein KBD52_00840 [Candidatus Pacebacteria bacterium]|nr:hypothetical protein [Candidatus Paceibacterota bacterium]